VSRLFIVSDEGFGLLLSLISSTITQTLITIHNQQEGRLVVATTTQQAKLQLTDVFKMHLNIISTTRRLNHGLVEKEEQTPTKKDGETRER
jgi:hypothetical protein